MSDGRIAYVGRTKDMLKVGGENVAAIEIESYLVTHPAVAVAQVVGVPDAEVRRGAGRLRRARSRGSELDESELIDFCTGTISSFKVPRYVRVVDAGRCRRPRSRSTACASGSAPNSG